MIGMWFDRMSGAERSKGSGGGEREIDGETRRDGYGRTGMRSAYFWRMRSASALRFSKGCSSLNLERIVILVLLEVVGEC